MKLISTAMVTRHPIEVNACAYAPIELPPRFVGNPQELMRLNIFSQDNSSRTHLAVRPEAHPARLLIYDGASRFDQKLTLNLVYSWDGEELVESTPVATDRQILSAMAARDDTGTLHQWVIYWLLRWPVRIGLPFYSFSSGCFIEEAGEQKRWSVWLH